MSAYGDVWASLRDALKREKQAARSTVRETEFLPAALEVVERPVSPMARRTAYVLLAGLGVMLLWLAFGRIDIVAAAEGQLEPVAHIQLVQPASPGIVRHLYVREGQKVRKGQVLLQLDPTLSAADVDQGRDALIAAELTAARARAILSALDGKGFRFTPPLGISPAMAADHALLARAQLAQIAAQSGEQSASSRAAVLAAAEARTQAKKLSESLPLLDQQLAANEALLSKGYVSKLRVLELQRQRAAAQRDREAALQTAARANAEAQAARNRGAGVGAGGRAEVLQSLVSAEADIAQRRAALAKASGVAGYGQLTAPVSGTIAQLAVTAEGGAVDALKPLMAIVPDGAMTAEVRLPNSDIGFVRVGQPVTVKVHAFPFSSYGAITGRIVSIGATAVQDDRLGLVYPVRVRLDPEAVRRFRLRPGMAVTADIRTGTRSLFEYLTSPVQRAIAGAGRER